MNETYGFVEIDHNMENGKNKRKYLLFNTFNNDESESADG